MLQFSPLLLLFSPILRRMSRRGLESNPLNLENMNNKRKRITRAGRQIVRNLLKGRAIIHEIDTKTSGLISYGGVHLAPIFLNTLSEGVSSFFKKDGMHVMHRKVTLFLLFDLRPDSSSTQKKENN